MNKEKNILMAVLSYIGPLIIVSYLLAKDNPFVKFHIKQSLSIIVSMIVISFLSGLFFFPFMMLFWLAKMGLGILVIIGIINALRGKEEELPLIGKLAESFNF